MMPLTTNYSPILDLISSARLGSYKNTFHPKNEYELYGVYLWCQQVGASIYPLVQNLEITVRNAIDNAAKKRFGDYWWNNIKSRKPSYQTNFIKKIEEAKNKLQRDWIATEKKRLGLNPWQSLPVTSITPLWSHDQIIAATDFSAWHYILNKDFISPNSSQNNLYLWPKSLNDAFKNYAIINSNQSQITKNMNDILFELRVYRNRLFHNEPLWVKAPNVVDATTAISTIRVKINKIEKIIEAIDNRKIAMLHKVGIFDTARRVCSIENLRIYTYQGGTQLLTKKQSRTLRGVYSKCKMDNETIVLEYAETLFFMHKFR
ncbi:Abi family protein [Pectobacterium parmentieri]|uniref:Abi family protein n=1 Tax=Pectobacterium parmentieri TaxID=1905730 RepID=UPI0020319AB1|nr:Abi family protein [Pectobacterium parmentieri]MCL6381646.1 hypothetical protein [Pectobacterium parmentieri]